MKSGSVLVTGAHGFLGRHVARACADNGATVTGIGHGSWGRTEAADYGVTFWHGADLTLDSLVTYASKPDAIVHCAGSGSVGFSVEQPHQDFARTVSNTAAVLEYVRVHSPATVLVYPSSAAVYGNAGRLPIHEGDALRPASPYGVHKVMAESLCRSYADHFGVSVAVVRFFSVYGEGLRKQLLWDACTRADRGDTSFFGTGDERRDWLHVDDAASLLEAAIEKASTACPTVNGASGHGIAVRDVLTNVLALHGANCPPTFTGVARQGDPIGYEGDIGAAEAWGWAPRVTLADGLRRYVAWYRTQSP